MSVRQLLSNRLGSRLREEARAAFGLIDIDDVIERPGRLMASRSF